MIGYDVKCKDNYTYQGSSLDKAFDCVKLEYNAEVGEIINDYYLIINNGMRDYYYTIGQYAPVIDIRYFDIIATDFNYDDRKDLINIKRERSQIILPNEMKDIVINYYRVK